MEKIKFREIKKYLNVFLLLAVLAVAMTAPFESEAAGRVDVDAQGKLALEYTYNDQPLEGAVYRIYRVADITPYGKYVLSGDFKDYSVNLEGLDSTGWKDTAATLSVYVSADHIVPLHNGKTDAQGQAEPGVFSTGMYLIEIESIRIKDITYQSSPFLVSLPSLGDDDLWNYEVTARPKTVDTISHGNGEMTVIKVWNDSGHQQNRPKEIEVTLLKDGNYYDKVTLSASNYWRHSWNGLSDESIWKAVEGTVPGDYTVTYTSEGVIYTITNTITGNHPGGGGDGDGGGGGGGSRKTDPPVYENIPDADVPEGNLEIPEDPIPLTGLPQTGLLWWPVPFLVITGLLLLGLGYKEIFGRKRKNHEK